MSTDDLRLHARGRRAGRLARGARRPGGRAVRGQARHRRPGGDARAPARRAAGRRARPPRGRARAGQDADRQDASPTRSAGASSACSSPPTSCPPTWSARGSTGPDTGGFDTEWGPGVLQLPARRRDQPRAGQGAVRAARGHAGAPGHDRPRDPRGARGPFLVLATQNPIESEGTYPLPEAQVDRFMFKLVVGYPDVRDEVAVVERSLGRRRRACARCSRPSSSRATSGPRARSTSTGGSWSTP